jgi:hypothetical protein
MNVKDQSLGNRSRDLGSTKCTLAKGQIPIIIIKTTKPSHSRGLFSTFFLQNVSRKAVNETRWYVVVEACEENRR